VAALDTAGKGAVISVKGLKTEYLTNPLGLEMAVPCFSWQLNAAKRNARQSAYRILAASTEERLHEGDGDVWDSGRVASDRCFEIPYAGRTLRSGERVFWRVEAWDEEGRASAPSDAAWFEMGLLEVDDWQGAWLAVADSEEAADRAAGLQWIWMDTGLDAAPVMFRFRFELSARPLHARLLVSAKDNLHGVWVNGNPLSLPPAISWGKMTEWPVELQGGTNLLCVEASALTKGFLEPDGGAVAVLLRVAQSDRSVRRLVSGPGWHAASNATEGWTTLDYDDGGWSLAAPTKANIACEPWPTGPAMLLRRRFAVTKPVARARLYATALGVYEAYLNGARVGEARLSPEISTADHHLFYQCYDVTAMLGAGANVLGAIVADGWYAGSFGWRHERFALGAGPKRFLGQLVIEYHDGSREVIASDGQWRMKPSPIVAADIYGGERYDARREDPQWATAEGHDEGWSAAALGADPKLALVAQIGPPIRVTEMRRPVAVRALSPTVFVADFGQNFSGWCRFKPSASAPPVVELRYGELLRSDGRVDQANLRGAAATDSFILRDEPDDESYEPRFTYHGFRYVECHGSGTLEAAVAHSDLPKVGAIKIENPLVQRICDNALWSQRSNFFGVPTDCPQRDERMGWLGDIQVFMDAACFAMDSDAFIRRFLREVRAGQSSEGAYPVVAPQPRGFPVMFTAGWSEAGIILPWTLYERYGDTAVIDENWQAMSRWMSFLADANPDWLWRNRRGLDLGDWLSVDAINPADETTPRILAATAYWAYAARLMAEMAQATGRSAEAERYSKQRHLIGEAFKTAFVGPNGVVGNSSQTSYVLALKFGLVPQRLRRAAAVHLAAEIERRGGKLSTGFLGTPYLLDVLCDGGFADTAIAVLLETDYPSWGHMIRKGATTMWERWNGDVGDLAMNSYNHYAFGAVVGFIYRRLAGIAPASPGFRRIAVRPLYDPRIGRVEVEHDACPGRIATIVDGDAKGLSQLALTVPANATAQVHLPRRSWRESGKALSIRSDIRVMTEAAEGIALEIGAGDYRFEIQT